MWATRTPFAPPRHDTRETIQPGDKAVKYVFVAGINMMDHHPRLEFGSRSVGIMYSTSKTPAAVDIWHQQGNPEPDTTFQSSLQLSGTAEEKTPGKWYKQWQTVQLFLCCISGVGVGVGHHFYYTYLDGREVENQAWIIRSGTAIAFLAKLLFSISIGAAFPQRVWQTLRSKALSIGAVDALFALRTEASSFANGEVLVRAKAACMMAATFWSLALVPILVSGSISVKPNTDVRLGTGISIQTLNFSKPLSDVQYNRSTPIFTLPLVDVVGVGAAPEQYVKPSSPASSFISNTLYGKRIIDAPSPCGANCSFSQSFAGPAYKCDDVDYTRNDTLGNPFCTTSYYGHGDCGGYFDPIMSSNAFLANWYMARNSSGDACAGLPLDEIESCAANAEAWWDGKLWVLYQYLLPEYRGTNTEGTNSTLVPQEAWERHLFMCQSYNATYSVKRTYRDFQQTVDGTVHYLNPINYTSLAFGASSTDTTTYAAWAIHQTLYSLLSGSIMPNGRLSETDSTGLVMSGLVQDVPFPLQPTSVYRSVMPQKPVQFLRQAMQSLHFNVTVGLLSLAPQLLYSQGETVDVETRNSQNVWSYNWRVLLVTYGGAALLDVVAIVIGIRAMMKNGGCSNLGFTRTVATTRANRALDELVGAWEHGMDPVPEKITKTRVIFRALQGERHRAGFECLDGPH